MATVAGFQLEEATCNQQLVNNALRRHDLRFDGRSPLACRPLGVTLRRFEGAATAELQLGRTRVVAKVTAELLPPFVDKPAEGMLQFDVTLSPMAHAGFEAGRPSPEAIELTRLVERGIRDSQAFDVEALCVVAGERVWAVRVDLHVLDHDGNLTDACVLAAMAALQHFRRPEVSVSMDGEELLMGGGGSGGGTAPNKRTKTSSSDAPASAPAGPSGNMQTMSERQFKIHHSDDREPQPLALHHVPLTTTFALLPDAASAPPGLEGAAARANEDGPAAVRMVCDPSAREEAVMGGSLTFSVNAHGELCALHKLGGTPLSVPQIKDAARVAAKRASELHEWLTAELHNADEQAQQEREQRLRGAAFADEQLAVGAIAQPDHSAASGIEHLAYDDLHLTFKTREDPKSAAATATAKDIPATSGLLGAMAKAAVVTTTPPVAEEGTATASSSGGSSRSGALDSDEEGEEIVLTSDFRRE